MSMTQILRALIQKNVILFTMGFLCLFLTILIFSRSPNAVKLEDNFRVEVTQKRQDFRLEQQTIALIVDDKRQMSPSELDQINTLVRAAVGYDPARGDVIRIMTMTFQKPAGMNFNKENMLLIIEAMVLLSLLLLFAATC
jgi:flagellar biosynthesis/type III secretory pathway M-ring protein FliF/YscJ